MLQKALPFFLCALASVGCKRGAGPSQGGNEALPPPVMGWAAGASSTVLVTVTGHQSTSEKNVGWRMSNRFSLRFTASPDGLRVHQEGLERWTGQLAPARFGLVYVAHIVPVLVLDREGLLQTIQSGSTAVVELLGASMAGLESADEVMRLDTADASLRAAASGFWNLAKLAHDRAMGKAPSGQTKVQVMDPQLGPMIVTLQGPSAVPVRCFVQDANHDCVEVTLTILPDKVALAQAERRARPMLPEGFRIVRYTVQQSVVVRVRPKDARLLLMTLTHQGTVGAEGPPGREPIEVRERERREYQFL